MYNHFAGDPHWIVSRWKSNCEGCGAVINRGTKAFYYPKGKHIYCANCGADEYAKFRAAAEDEYRLTGPLDDSPTWD